ncbi:metalloregulator ArsR/SmtB family transcription factor [Thermococcus sp. 101 C5]|uniref:ArsR/SmtB family transcription factor n=1 Tax=Thermococcus TaxID=2263 RepID=UPI00128DA949|nr:MULTISPECIES: metalloregulator ArsR/SmtB family transcription factor [Thermococcus]MCA6214703.1 helix-turn-helix transcriptional regulator [Thermococcus bergensis]MPW39667.1 metalloregulator ArsR/SmtB family transcription factor [Thermococcus sp. 101 C5]
MKVRELIESLNEKQRATVQKCLASCEILDLDEEIETELSRDLVDFLKVLSNPIRAGIIKMLKNRWMCVCLIAKALNQDQTLISHHIRTLKEMNLLHERREGKLRFYRTNLEELKKYVEMLEKELL